MLTKEEIAKKLSTQQSRLRYFRELNNVTIDKICLDTGINRSTYNLLERDPSELPQPLLCLEVMASWEECIVAL